MRTRAVTPVHTMPRSSSRTAARIYPDAILRLTPDRRGGGCRGWWMKRESGGFVCSDRLGPTSETSPRPSPRDLPRLREGAVGFRVIEGGSHLYESLDHIDRRRPHILLFKGAVLSVRRTFERYGARLHQTREGWFARAERTVELPPPLGSLAVEIGEKPPFAVVVGRQAVVRREPSAEAAAIGEVARWGTLEADDVATGEDGWFALRAGGFVHDDDLARLRPAPAPPRLGEEERWLAVDVGEQLFHVYEGERLLRVMPCSTGWRGNTHPGIYRVQWKRRLQTLRPRGGHLRTEDVQWVMYYHRQRSIAIHAAYWHHDFGRPVSLGCVNLTPEDARWVYEYASPRSLPEDSENFPTNDDPGTRVIVFR